MEHTFRGRKVLALMAVVPLVVGLTACANGDDSDDKPKSKQTRSADKKGDGGGGLLPFGGGGDGPAPGPTEDGPNGGGGTGGGGGFGGGDGGNGGTGGSGGGGTGGSGGTGGGGGASGRDVVRLGNTDLSSIDWQTVCSTSDGYTLTGGDSKYSSSSSEAGATFLVTADSQGKVESVFMFGEDASDNVSYSSTSGGTPPQLNYSNGRMRVSGEGSSFSGDAMKFEIDVACDLEF